MNILSILSYDESTLHKQNCDKFFFDLKTAISKNDVNIVGSLDQKNYPKPTYFNFFECNEYKYIQKYEINEISFNPNDIDYPYNKYYSITNNNGKIKINLYD